MLGRLRLTMTVLESDVKSVVHFGAILTWSDFALPQFGVLMYPDRLHAELDTFGHTLSIFQILAKLLYITKITCKLTLDTGDHHCKISNIFIYRYIDMQISYNYMFTGPYILVIPCAQRPDPYWLNLWAKGTFGKLYLIIDINHTEVGVFCAIDGACGHDVAVSFEEFCHRVSTPLCTIP